MGRKFFYVCAGMFLLALCHYLWAGRAAASGGLASPSEVAVAQGVIHAGEAIPLPVYADGTVASEADCGWIVSEAVISSSGSPSWCYAADANYGVAQPASFLNGHHGRIVNLGPAGGGYDPVGCANYLIIASRGATLPTTTSNETWGQLKSRYAPKGGTVSKGADTR
jgi:hypothetical protein